MKRALVVVVVLAAVVALLVVISPGGDSGGYKVRAIFDNANFVVKGEEVRIAGAKVGSVESVDVTLPGQTATQTGTDAPGKAAVVMKIEDPGFRDFRSDASCLIRPQSLIGEKFIDCQPTQPRAAGSEPPSSLAELPAGQAGAGQHLLPLEQNGKTVDLDLVQNILRRPYADRFRLILNELGAGLAARGPDLALVVDRANPALRETDKVLSILASENQRLAQLSEDSDAILSPLARERDHLTGFFANADVTNQAVLERRPQFEAGLRKLPAALRDVKTTMASLKGLAAQGTPLFTSLDEAGPYISKATQKLGPLAGSAIPALQTLGDAGQAAGPKLVAADPVVLQTRDLGNAQKPTATNLAALLQSFNRTNGFKYLTDFIYNTAGSSNGFDNFGHYLRANLQVTSCLDYQAVVYSGCESFFTDTGTSKPKKKKKTQKRGLAPSAARAASPPSASPQDATGMLDFLLGDPSKAGP